MRDTTSRNLTGTDMSAPTNAALEQFRTGFYGCLSGWGDALFELTDATLCTPAPVSSVPTLSLEPTFRRSHGSLYKCLARGEIDDTGLRVLLMAHLPPDWPLVFAVDASSWPRCDAETSPERGFYYSASKHSAGKPIVAGWSYQWMSQLRLGAGLLDGPVRRTANPALREPHHRHHRPSPAAAHEAARRP